MTKTKTVRKPVRSSKLPRREIPQLKKALWSLCREITAKRYPDDVCFTCGRMVGGKGKQLGHFIASSIGGASLRYNLDNLRWQCYNCNINKSGNWPAFLENLTKELGKKRVAKLISLKNLTITADRYFYEQKIAEYTQLLKNLQ